MRHQRVLIPIVIGWYLILALGHYFNQRPLWIDEQCVLNSIIKLKPVSLFTRPLLDKQAFPRLYLWVIQQFSRTFNQNLLSLRFFPLIAMTAAFFVWVKIARRVLNESWDLIIFIVAWGASIPLVYYAAELKPYSMDVLNSAFIVLFLLGQEQIQINTRAYRATLLLLPLLGLFSYATIFLLLLPLYNLVRESFEIRRWHAGLTIYLGSYVLMLVLLCLFDLRVSVPHLLETSWHDYFISLDSFRDFFNSLGKGMNNLISRRFAENPRWVKEPSRIFIGVGVGYMFLAFWGQFKRDRYFLRSIVPLAFAMFLIQLVLAILRIFPFSVPRMSLFYSPLLILMTIMAINAIYQQRMVWGLFLRFAFTAFLIFVSLGIAWDIFLKGDLGALATLYSRI